MIIDILCKNKNPEPPGAMCVICGSPDIEKENTGWNCLNCGAAGEIRFVIEHTPIRQKYLLRKANQWHLIADKLIGGPRLPIKTISDSANYI